MPDTINTATTAAPPPLQPGPIANLKIPQSFSVNCQNAAESWQIFKQRWETYSALAMLNRYDEVMKVNILIHCFSDDVLRVYNSFEFPTPASDRTVKEIIEIRSFYCW